MLTADHRKVEAMFDRYEKEKDGEAEARRELAQEICNELTVHTQLEEELFYPWLRENLKDDDMELVEEAVVEHAAAKDLIAQLEAADEVDDAFDAKVKVLGEQIKHHAGEEEEEIFPKVKSEREALDELGQEMFSRKAELLEDIGLELPQGGRSREEPPAKRPTH
jgi:hemerythrin superfamily protein